MKVLRFKVGGQKYFSFFALKGLEFASAVFKACFIHLFI
jgi:hypothetical protein